MAIVTKASVGDHFRGEPLKPACPETHAGYWVCLNHPDDPHLARFRNQLQKDIHIQKGTHRLAWWCYDHGAEAP